VLFIYLFNPLGYQSFHLLLPVYDCTCIILTPHHVISGGGRIASPEWSEA